MVETFQQDIFTRVDLAEDGCVFIIGTRVAQIDFYIKLIDLEMAQVNLLDQHFPDNQTPDRQKTKTRRQLERSYSYHRHSYRHDDGG